MNGLRLVVLACGLAAGIAACDGQSAPPPDAGTDAPIDTRSDTDSGTPPDAAPDQGAPDTAFPTRPITPFCGACRHDSDCGEGNRCMTLMNRERSCGRACTDSADCASLGSGYECVAEFDGLSTQCRPRSLTCLAGSEPGAECGGASGLTCTGRYDRCVDTDGLGLACTSNCVVDADCPGGMRRCRQVGDERVCVFDEASGPERCRVLMSLGRATACGPDRSCPSGRTCYGNGSIQLCLATAPATGCGMNAVARMTASGTEVCVPNSSDHDGWGARTTADCECVLDDSASAIDAAGALVRRSRCDMTFKQEDMAIVEAQAPGIVFDRYRVGVIDRIHGYWPGAERFSAWLEREVTMRGTSMASPVGRILELGYVGDFRVLPATPRRTTTLHDAVHALVDELTATQSIEEIDAQVEAMDPALRERLAGIVVALHRAITARAIAISHLDADAQRMFDGAPGLFLQDFPLDLGRPDVRGAFLGDVDVGLMISAARDLADAIAAADLTNYRGPGGELTIDTPVGRVAVRGAEANMYQGVEWARIAFLLELGGNDTYFTPAGANTNLEHGVGIVVDVGGEDRYQYPEVRVPADTGPPGSHRLPSDGTGPATSPGRFPATSGSPVGPVSLSSVGRQGAARLGIAMLFDLGTDADHYRSLRLSQAFAGFGVGVLYDAGGDDTYESEAASQACAQAGFALLLDAAGDDQYTGYYGMQGAAASRGVALLVDLAGDDQYVADATDTIYPSAQDPTMSNVSMSQGAGYGRRADGRPDGQFMSGGVGALIDLRGVDRYTAAIFAQGTGYWFGVGVLTDVDGNDHYDGRWYVQGANAHYATSVFRDRAGNDEYNEAARRMNATLGAGHDFSVAWFLDHGGDDHYRGPGLTLGAGNSGGAGYFVDFAGTDTYEATSNFSFGNASIEIVDLDTLQALTGTWGFFIDVGGTDAYTRPDTMNPRNDGEWLQETNRGYNEHGVGIDRGSGPVGL